MGDVRVTVVVKGVDTDDGRLLPLASIVLGALREASYNVLLLEVKEAGE
jgi:hypothetical protein